MLKNTNLLDGLDKDSKRAIEWFAAEFHYLKELKEELEKIKQDTAVSEQERDYKRIRHTWYYIGRCERRAERKVQVVIEDLKKAISIKPELIRLGKQIEISSEQLLKAFSFYTGDFKDKLVNLLVIINLRKERPRGAVQKEEINIRHIATEAEQHIDTLIIWVGGLEATLRKVETISKSEDDDLETYAKIFTYELLNNNHIIHLVSGLNNIGAGVMLFAAKTDSALKDKVSKIIQAISSLYIDFEESRKSKTTAENMIKIFVRRLNGEFKIYYIAITCADFDRGGRFWPFIYYIISFNRSEIDKIARKLEINPNLALFFIKDKRLNDNFYSDSPLNRPCINLLKGVDMSYGLNGVKIIDDNQVDVRVDLMIKDTEKRLKSSRIVDSLENTKPSSFIGRIMRSLGAK
jgi:hypothetical protein